MTHPTAPDPALGTCRSCGARIRWVTTTDGKAMPLDPPIVPDGNVVPTYVEDPTGLRVVRAQILTTEQARAAHLARRPTWRSHFATCPRADAHRRAAATTPSPDHTPQELPL